MKICTKCERELPLDAFGVNRQAKDLIHYTCRECCRKSVRKYRDVNPEKNREQHQKWRAENREQERLKSRQRSAGNGRVTYLIEGVGTPLVKIGKTTLKPTSRLSSLQVGSPVPLILLATTPTPEAELHAYLDGWRQHGEWFLDSPILRAFVDYIRDNGALPARSEWFFLYPWPGLAA